MRAANAVAPAGELALRPAGFSRAQRDLIRVLAYMHLVRGQTGHALALLRLAVQEWPQDRQFLRAYAHALTLAGQGGEALLIIDRLDDLEKAASPPVSLLLRSRALHGAGRLEEARAVFRRFVALRRPDREASLTHSRETV